MMRSLLHHPFLFLLLVVSLGSCGKKYYYNGKGVERPTHQSVFRYDRRFARSSSVMDTQAVYMHSWAYSSPPGADSAHYYLRFLSDGRVALFSGSSNLNNADEASVGYYYLKGDRLRIEYFTVTYGNHGGLSHFLAYRRGEGFVTYGQFLGENVHGSFLLTGLMYRHQMGQWKKIIPDTLRHLRPDW